MRGLILAGGKGTRLLPATRVVNKHMIPILNNPMITYPLKTLKSFGITNIMIISGGGHIGGIAEFLGDGSEFGIELTYRVQMEAGGIAQALGLAKDFVGNDKVMVILGDNIFDNDNMPMIDTTNEDAYIFAKKVNEPQRFGVLTFEHEDHFGYPFIVEKPQDDIGNSAVVGLYVYPPDVFEIVSGLKPSARGELEITDVNNFYLTKGNAQVKWVTGFWSDAGTPESLKEVTDWAYGQNKKNVS